LSASSGAPPHPLDAAALKQMRLPAFRFFFIL